MNITFADEQDDPLQTELLMELANTVLTGESFPSTTEVAITFVAEPRITDLNATYMGKQGPTDVLSFPLEELVPGVVPVHPANGPPISLGDVVICPSVVHARAASAGVACSDEMALMVAHGLLHLLGYDHIDDAEAEQMEARERDYLSTVGLVRS